MKLVATMTSGEKRVFESLDEAVAALAHERELCHQRLVDLSLTEKQIQQILGRVDSMYESQLALMEKLFAQADGTLLEH